MIVLEKLYNCADEHLSTEVRSWEKFAREFAEIFSANIIFYRIELAADRSVNLFAPIATSDPAVVKKYIADKMYEFHPMAESEMPSLEPDRRTDVMSDDDFKNMGSYADALIALGVFYLMIVPAKLPDGAYLGLVTWRDEKSGDFSDVEKQRIALFMRHLLAVVGMQEFLLKKPDSAILVFGEKYQLTKTEVQILSALLQGHSLKTIGDESDRTYGTVRWHVQNILGKCQVGTQKDLMREFYQLIKN